MTLTTSTIKTEWTTVHTELFSVCKDMFTVNPTTGKAEQKTDNSIRENLILKIARITLGEVVEEQHKCAA